jgi:hypothetical protein
VEQRPARNRTRIQVHRYANSPVIVREDGEEPDPDSFSYSPTTWPGARLPHIWLDDGTAIADYLGRCFTLLHAPGAGAPVRDLSKAFAWIGAPFATFEMRSAAVGSVYEDRNLILVRPDPHVVWRRRDKLPSPDALAALAAGNVMQPVVEGQAAR